MKNASQPVLANHNPLAPLALNGNPTHRPRVDPLPTGPGGARRGNTADALKVSIEERKDSRMMLGQQVLLNNQNSAPKPPPGRF